MKPAFPPSLALFFCYLFFSVSIFAQNPPGINSPNEPSDALGARQLIAEASALIDSGQFAPAAERAQRAHDFYRKTPGEPRGDLAEAAYLSGFALSRMNQFEPAQPFFEESAAIFQELYPDGNLRGADALQQVSNGLRMQGKFKEALETCSKAYAIRQQFLPANHPKTGASLRLIGTVYQELGQFAEATPFFEKALEINKINYGEESLQYAGSLSMLGQNAHSRANYDQSIELQERALAIRQKKLPPGHPELAGSCMALGTTFRSLRRFDEALDYFGQALDIYLTTQQQVSISFAYSEIGQTYRAKGEPAKALDYYIKGATILEKLNYTNELVYAYLCTNLGHAYIDLHQLPAAIEWHEKALAIYRVVYKEAPIQLAVGLLNLGKVSLANSDFERGIRYYNEAKQIWQSTMGSDFFDLSSAEAGLGNAYRIGFIQTGQRNMLDQSRQYFQAAEQRIENRLQNETLAATQRKVIAEARPIFEKSIQTELLFIQSHNNEQAALEKAWQLSEAMHSYLLFAATQEADARHFAGIPDEQLHKDSLLRAETISLENQRQSLLQDKGLTLTDSSVLALNARIFAKTQENKQLRADFEARFPDYYRLKYDRKTVTLEAAQKMLAPEQTLLEYFTGDSSIFVFVLGQNDKRVVELPRDFPLSDWVRDFRKGISDYHTALEKTSALYEKTVRQYADNAQKLYAKLLAPIAGFLSPELVVIPGEELADLPFEALLSAAPKDLSNFNTYPFLLRRHTIHYAYSATMLQQMTTRQHFETPEGSLLAFAPFFEGDMANLEPIQRNDDTLRLGFTPLPYSGEEIFRAQMQIGGHSKVMFGKDATKQAFQAFAGGFQIIHLATHAKANRQSGDFSYLSFGSGDNKINNSLLSAGELYNFRLNADLVVLSACETGIGEQQRGEGVVSLAQAFAFAGAKSILTSMWKVNDKSTMQLMDKFYGEIKSGKPKNVALVNAKRQYLAQNPGLAAHPFFWAGFVGVGDMRPLKN